MRATSWQSKRCHLAANEGERAEQFMLASIWGLTASSNVKLAWAWDKAQFVFTSLRGGINIAAASQFPLARSLLSCYLSSLCCHPHRLEEQSTDAARHTKIFTHSVLAEDKGHSFALSDVQHSKKPCMHALAAPSRPHAFLPASRKAVMQGGVP